MMMIAELVLLAESMGVRVRWAQAASMDELAVYEHATRTIWLRDGRADMPTRCSLAHELGHAHYRHEPHGDYRAQERSADEWAARLLVSEDEYRSAERLVGHEVGALARELDVTHRLVIAWRRCHKAV